MRDAVAGVESVERLIAQTLPAELLLMTMLQRMKLAVSNHSTPAGPVGRMSLAMPCRRKASQGEAV